MSSPMGVDLEEAVVNMPSTLGETRTSVQFVLMSLAMAFDMKPKQALALLTNNHKYLMHICVKGVKGNDYEKVLNWYELVYP